MSQIAVSIAEIAQLAYCTCAPPDSVQYSTCQMRSLASASRPASFGPDIVDLHRDRGGVGVLGDAVPFEPGVGLDLDKADGGGVLPADAEPAEIGEHAQRRGGDAGDLVVLHDIFFRVHRRVVPSASPVRRRELADRLPASDDTESQVTTFGLRTTQVFSSGLK